ncbi:MAG: histidine phosphatase family protein [Bacillaceae bacterium]|nr:histidine phosphatase family protein [Bacillaceae bacterium]
MVTIYLTRHGETKWNVENRLQGSMDSPLTKKGIADAICLFERLKDVNFQAIYSSPSERALQTARYIKGEKDVPIDTIEELKELNFGDWEGKTKDEIALKHNPEYQNFWNRPHTYNHAPHKGEGLTDFKRRVETAVKKSDFRQQEQNCVDRDSCCGDQSNYGIHNEYSN